MNNTSQWLAQDGRYSVVDATCRRHVSVHSSMSHALSMLRPADTQRTSCMPDTGRLSRDTVAK